MTNDHILIKSLIDSILRNDKSEEATLVKQIYKNKSFATNGKDGKSVLERFFEKIVWTTSNCWFWIGHIDNIGYGRFAHLGTVKAHRASWILHNGPIPEGMSILHKCDVRSCVNPDHLFLGTQLDNMRDAASKKRTRCFPKRGKDSHFAKLTESQVLEIRELKKNGTLSQADIARRFKMSPMSISRIINNQSWKIKNENI